MKLGLRPQVPRTPDRQDPRRPRALGAALVGYAQAAGHHQHRQGRGRQAGQRRRQLAPGRIADHAQPGAGRRDRAAGRGRRCLSPGRSPPVRRRRHDEHSAASPAARRAAGGISAEAHVHEARASGDAEPAGADRRARQADRQRQRRKCPRAATTRCSPIIGRPCPRNARFRRGSSSSRARCSTCAAGASSTISCSARWTPTAASTMPCSSATRRSASPAASAPRRSRSSTAPTLPGRRTSRT